LIVFRASEDESSSIDEMFHKMMAAIKLDINQDIAILKMDNQFNFIETKNWLSKENEQFILVFGINPEQIGLHINHLAYKPIRHYNSTILFCHSLEAIHFDVNMKKRLWNVLKNHFQ
jgi:hypothetical protein